MTFSLPLFLRALLVLAATTFSLEGIAAPYVVLKLDDLHYEDGLVHPGWLQVIDFLDEEGVPAAIGIVGKSIADASSDYVEWVQQRDRDGHEIWHHGFCHCRQTVDGVEIREYRGTSYAEQSESLNKTQALSRERLGIELQTFGAPYNSSDAFTAEALGGIDGLRVWLYKDTEHATDKFVIKRIKSVNIEYPVHVPDFEQFKAGYEQHKTEPILVIQGHPRSWVNDPQRFEEFKQIVLFLKAQGAQFITPIEYYHQQ